MVLKPPQTDSLNWKTFPNKETIDQTPGTEMSTCDPAMAPGAIEAVVEASNDFSFELYKEANNVNDKENLVMSASSVSTVLAMLMAGAEGKTLMQIKNSLNLNQASVAHVGYRCLLPQLSSDDFDLNVANRIFVMEGFSPKTTFLEMVAGNYFSSVGEIDFASNQMAANMINTWVEGQTMQKIKNLIDPATLSSDTRLVLVNAIYFKADWKFPFDKELTKEKIFILEDSIFDKKDVNVMMMAQEAEFEVCQQIQHFFGLLFSNFVNLA